MDHILSDLRHALRQIRRAPLFAVVAGASLAIGVGVNAGLFSAVDALLLRPVPGVGHPEQVVEVGRSNQGHGFDTFAYPDFLDLRAQVGAFASAAAYALDIFAYSDGGEGTRVPGIEVTPEYFGVMGVVPARGRFFTAAEDEPGSRPTVAVVSYDFWQDRLGGDPDVLGRTIRINRIAFQVVGVTPADFHGHMTGFRPDVYVPLRARPMLANRSDADFGNRRASWHLMVARLGPGATVAEADAQVKAVYARLAKAYPESDHDRSGSVVPLGLVPGGGRGPVKAFLAVLMSLAALILLVTCANVAGMFVARSSHREKEIAVRLALGAGRGRLVRQLLVEALVVFALGGVTGTVVGVWVMQSLPINRLPLPIPVFIDLSPDPKVLAFALAITLGTGLVFGLLPALQATRLDLMGSLRDDGSNQGGRAGLLRRFFVGGQVGLSLVLLASAGFFLRALQRAGDTQTGFDPHGAYVTGIDLDMEGYSQEEGAALQARLLERLGALPGVERVALAADLPLDLSNMGTGVVPEGWTPPTSQEYMGTEFDDVTSGYFGTLGIPVLQGRGFTPQDDAGSEPVMVVSRAFADRVWPGASAVGKRVKVYGKDEPWRTVVGVVEDVKNTFITDTPKPMMYLPIPQNPQQRTNIVVRARGGIAAVAPALRRAILGVDPSLSMNPVISLEQSSGLGILPQRVAAALTTVLGALALLLSALGVYGVVAYALSRRVRELGVRMALGAGSARVARLVLRQGLGLALPGILVGVPAVVALGFVLRSFLLGLSPMDPVALIAVPAVLVVAVVVACAAPARRAASVSPMEALRSE
jgi:predicted permease